MIKKNKITKISSGLLALLFSATLWAHGGAAGTDTDQCKFELEKDHWLHYTAYQPNSFPAEEFCASLPKTNEKILLVFDYQDQRYRGNTVEFEVTKEPEGTRVFFLPGAKHKSGTVELVLPNGVPEPGKYLIHITLVPDKGERLDAHMSFSAGGGAATAKTTYALYVLGLFGALYMAYLSSAGFKRKVDEIFAKIVS
ncbi:hypothetical protein [Crenothrix sp.]|uniref:hypothetical protein n=1 Tax=Crenothrix sp. TaxID=3100433 RepID=UPI00374D9AEE